MSGLVALAGRRFFRRHPWHFALALVGVALGVAVVTGVDLAGNAARNSFDTSLTAVVGKATHQLQPAAGTLDETLYPRLREELGPTLPAMTPSTSCPSRNPPNTYFPSSRVASSLMMRRKL